MTRDRCRGFQEGSRIVFIILKGWQTKDFTEDTAKMLCHVTRPDSVVMEVEVDAKANGEDCLNKVRCVGIHIEFCVMVAF